MPASAAIDIGSNGIRLAIGTLTLDGAVQLSGSWREPVRLGKEVFASGRISEETLSELERALLRLRVICEEHRAPIRTVATSALREAKNQKRVIKEVKKRTGLSIELLPAEEEARLVFLAVAEWVTFKDGLALLIDIGGGSIEVSLVENGELIRSETAPMGALRVLQLFESRNASPKLIDRLVREYARGVRQQFIHEHRKYAVASCYGTGGNIEALGQLRKTICGESATDRITLPELSAILEKLQSLSISERIRRLGLRPDRADVIFPAAAVLYQLLLESKVDELYIPGVGLKEGVLLEQLRERPQTPEARRQALLDYGVELGRRYDFDEAHGKTVAKLSRSLFSQLQDLHRLPSEFALYLELAALLHDIGQFISYPGHHKHSYYLLQHSTFVGLLPWERQMVASIARYHRKSQPRREHPSFADLRAEDRTPMCQLASLLRIADALDRQHQSRVSEIAIEFSKEVATLRISGDGDMPLESWAVQKKADMFEKTFDRQLIVATGATIS